MQTTPCTVCILEPYDQQTRNLWDYVPVFPEALHVESDNYACFLDAVQKVWRDRMHVDKSVVKDMVKYIVKHNVRILNANQGRLDTIVRLVLVYDIKVRADSVAITPYAVAQCRCFNGMLGCSMAIQALASCVENRGYGTTVLRTIHEMALIQKCVYLYLEVPRSEIEDASCVETFRQNPWEQKQCLEDGVSDNDRIKSDKRTDRTTRLLKYYHKMGFQYQMANRNVLNCVDFEPQYAYRLVKILTPDDVERTQYFTRWTCEADLKENYDRFV